MRLRIALAFSIFSTPALAIEAITYKGTIGAIPVIVEMAEAGDDGVFVGRYAYAAKGIDIPLHGTARDDGGLAIEEEAPCEEKTCKNAGGDLLEQPPVGADWSLTGEKAGKSLKGTWKDRKSGKSLPIVLEQVGSRSLPDGAQDMGMDGLDPMSASRSRIDMKVAPNDLPYDFLKLDHPLEQGPETPFEGATIRTDTDPRTGTAYPTIVKLPGADTTAINTYLKQQWLQFQLPARWCQSRLYLAYGWSGMESDGTNGYEDGGSTVTIELLTPRLLGLVENGSYYCGGAYPDNFENRHFADVRTGEPVEAERLLKGWVPKNADGEEIDPATAAGPKDQPYGPNAELVKFVNDRRDRSDASREADCGMPDLVASNLGVHFTQTELVFNLKDLPHVIFACTDDLVRVPLKDARPLLNEDGVRLLLGP